MVARFFVAGIPQPQGSARAFVNKRTMRAIVTSDNPKLKGWRDTIVLFARKHFREATTGPVSLELAFYLPAPKKPVREMHTTRPDLDKLVRAIGDALKDAGAYADDSQIIFTLAAKSYASANAGKVGVSIIVET